MMAKAELEQVQSASQRRLEWVLAHLETYERRPVVFVPKGSGYVMRSRELFPDVCELDLAIPNVKPKGWAWPRFAHGLKRLGQVWDFFCH